MYDIKYNGASASSYDLILKKRINMSSPIGKHEGYDVKGKDGSYIEMDGNYEDISMAIQFILKNKSGSIYDSIRNIKKWLLSNGTNKLEFTEDPNYFYLVKKVEIGEFQILNAKACIFSVKFMCEPFQYLVSGESEYSISQVLNNPYSECHPIYVVTAQNTGIYKLTVNGNTVEINVVGKTYIDTEKMITYRESGIKNSLLTGDYTNLYLKEGQNTITTSSSSGYTPSVKVVPRWRCL